MRYKNALVLSGGANRGLGQAGAIAALRDLGLRFDLIAGVSVGALNGAMVAQNKINELAEIWHRIGNRDVYTGKLNAWHLAKALLLGKKGILGHEPLQELIDKHVDLVAIRSAARNNGHKTHDPRFIAGFCDLKTGRMEYQADVNCTPNMMKTAVLASALMPVVWEPVNFEGMQAVDGGIRDNSPLGEVLKYQPQNVVIINCSRPAPRKPERQNLLQIAARSFELIQDELLTNDIREFTRINELVYQHAQHTDQALRKPDGTPYRYFNTLLIQPEVNWGEFMDFETKTAYNQGWDAAMAAAAEIDLKAFTR